MASILKIGERLSKIVDLCPNNSKVVADIGCDHGFVSAELILENKAKQVIATEVSEKCIMKAVKLADEINITPFLSFRIGDGFAPITKYDKIDFCVIAGLGGLEIIEILKKRPKGLYNFVLQPMNKVYELRKYLVKNRFHIDIDVMVYENGKYYNIIRVEHGNNDLADIELFFGRSNFNSKNFQLFYDYLQIRHKELLKLKEANGDVLSDKTEKELEMVEQAINLFEETVNKKPDEEKDKNLTEASQPENAENKEDKPTDTTDNKDAKEVEQEKSNQDDDTKPNA